MTVEIIINRLKALADPEKVLFKKKKFGVAADNALGVYQKDLNILAKEIGQKNAQLAIDLFDTGIYEARCLCSKVFPPKEITSELMEKWVVTFENWEICDSFSMKLFAKSPLAVLKINEWADREREFERRAAFATMAGYCMADKKAGNEVYEAFFPLIKNAATDERLYVKKAVNWALRSIGKRNIDLNKQAIEIARDILQLENKAAQWIAKDALRELEKENVNILDYPRKIYRP
jgi:3-methyladenine DNA glycosylase AlkD